MDNKKMCKKCQHNKPLEAFEEGFLTCTKCREKGRNRYYRKWEHYQELRKEHKKNNPEKTKESNDKYRMKTHFCKICNYEIKLRDKNKHEITLYHLDRLNRLEHPEKYENEEKPDGETTILGKQYFQCNKCNLSILTSNWHKHILTKEHITRK